MPNYFSNPATAGRRSLNALATAAQLSQSGQRNGLARRKSADTAVEIQADFHQLKAGHISKVASSLISLPADQRSRQYGILMNKVIPAPIAEHPVLGPLGASETDQYIQPEDFVKLSDEQQVSYLKALALDSDDFAKVNLAEEKGKIKTQEIINRHAAKIKEITAGGSTDIDVAREKGEIEMRTAREKSWLKIEEEKAEQKDALELERERQKGRLKIAEERAKIPSATASTEEDLLLAARQIVEGRLNMRDLPKRGRDRVRLFAMIEEMSPGFDIQGQIANMKYREDAANLRVRALVQGVTPLYEKILELGKKLENTNIQKYNRAINWVKEQTGDPDIVAFNNLRDDTIAETERILMGSGVLSDSKYLRALNNVNTAQSYAQLEAAIAQMKLTVETRLHALDVAPFPNVNPNVPSAPESGTGTAESFLESIKKK